MQGPAGRLYQAAREYRMLVHETNFVAEGVRAIETAFAPGLRFDRSKDGAVRLSAHAPVAFIEVVYREVQMVRIRPSVPGVAISPRVEACKDDAAAPEVMPAGRDPSSWLFKDSRVKDCGVFDT